MPPAFIEKRILELQQLRARLGEELARTTISAEMNEIDYELRIIDTALEYYASLRDLETQLANKRN